MSNWTADPACMCPTCLVTGTLEFRVVSVRFVREFKDSDGKLQRLHYGRSADYRCATCECEFILTDVGKRPRLTTTEDPGHTGPAS